MKHRMALPTNTTTLKVIKTVDSTTVVGLFLDLSCSCKMANTSTPLSLGSMLFVTQTQAARNLSLCRQPTAYFLLWKIEGRMHLFYRVDATLWYLSIILLERDYLSQLPPMAVL